MRFLDLARAGAIDLAISEPILAEVQRVLGGKFHWPSERISDIEPRLSAFTRRVTPRVTLDVVKDDPDDNRILECAEAAGSDYIVTGDDDLLRLEEYSGLQILKVSDFLHRLAILGQ